jgi:regulatory protein
MNLLARREHSFQELFNKLNKRFAEYPDILLRELQKLNEEGLQSDLRMVEAFVRSRINRGQGPIKISSDLRARGISDALVEIGIRDADVDWFALVADVAERKFGSAEVIELKEKARRVRFLQQRGFSFEHINAVLD